MVKKPARWMTGATEAIKNSIWLDLTADKSHPMLLIKIKLTLLSSNNVPGTMLCTFQALIPLILPEF